MRNFTLAALLLLLVQSQAPKEVLEGQVVRAGSREPISDVLITLTAPPPANSVSNLAPDAAARLNDQIANLTESGARAGVSQQVIESAIENARRNAGATVGRQLTASTDSSGHFSFRDLAPGRYTVRAEKDGYFALPINGNSSTQVTKTIVLQEGKPAAPEDLVMVKGGVVSGRIRDPNGQPISGMNVSVYRVTYSNGRKIWTPANSKPTDDRGEYRIFWLVPGQYYVGVTPRAPGPTPGPQDTWARTFFPGATEPADAVTVELKDGGEAERTDVTIRTQALTMFKISGVVVNSAARPNPTTGISDRSISSFVLSPKDPGVLDSLNPLQVANALPAASRQNGEFELRNIRPGSYDLYPLAPVLTDPAPLAAGAVTLPPGTTALGARGNNITGATRRQPTSRTPIDVNRDIADLRIVVSAGVPLSGDVIVNGTASPPIKPESIRLTLRNLDTMPTAFTSLIGAIPVDSAGKFAAQGVPEARYTFQITGLPPSAFVADIRQGGTSAMDNGFVLDASATPVQVVIESAGATMQGVVQDNDGKPAAAATVVLVPPPARRQNSLLYRNTTTDDDGKFTLRGIPPGPYTVFAWESVPSTAWQNAEYLQKYEGRGRTISVTANAVSEVPLNLIPSEDRR
jgi:protocatechuate 3,4-dioxygenase beta subunit